MEISKVHTDRKLKGLIPDCLSSLYVPLNTVLSLLSATSTTYLLQREHLPKELKPRRSGV